MASAHRSDDSLSIEDLRLDRRSKDVRETCRLTAPFSGVFLSCARFREVAVVVFYLCIRGTVAELAVDGWMACGGLGRLFSDDTFVFVTVVMFDHCPIGMTRACVLLYVWRFYCRYAVGLGVMRIPMPFSLLRASAASGVCG